MSTVVEVAPVLKSFVPSNMKDEERKIGKIESLGCELRENTDIAKDLSKEITKKTEHTEVFTEVVKEVDDSNACLKSHNEELSIIDQKLDEADDSLNKEKQVEVPRTIEVSAAAGSKNPQVQILSLSVISPGRADLVLPIPFPTTTSKATLFTLKEGSKYRIKFHLTVSGNTINNLKYTYMVWKSGLRVHQTKKMVGTFSPRQEPYIYELEEGTTPTGFFARGPFLVRSKFVDDEENCYLDTTYYFDIRKDWGAKEK